MQKAGVFKLTNEEHGTETGCNVYQNEKQKFCVLKELWAAMELCLKISDDKPRDCQCFSLGEEFKKSELYSNYYQLYCEVPAPDPNTKIYFH